MVNLGSLWGMGQLKDKVYELECVVPKAHERVSVASEEDKCIDLGISVWVMSMNRH